MRLMSFSLTTEQIRARTKTVTRRLGWGNLQQGERFGAIEKGQGLPRGTHVVRLGVLECVSNWPEPLWAVTDADVALEGFPGMTRAEFIEMFCELSGYRCEPTTRVNRILFRYVEEGRPTAEDAEGAGGDGQSDGG